MCFLLIVTLFQTIFFHLVANEQGPALDVLPSRCVPLSQSDPVSSHCRLDKHILLVLVDCIL